MATSVLSDEILEALEKVDELEKTVQSSADDVARAEAEFEFTPKRDRDLLELGEVRLKILETPGHSPDSISILVYDLKRDAHKPHAVLAGDTLFIGDVGRPDLRASLG